MQSLDPSENDRRQRDVPIRWHSRPSNLTNRCPTKKKAHVLSPKVTLPRSRARSGCTCHCKGMDPHTLRVNTATRNHITEELPETLVSWSPICVQAQNLSHACWTRKQPYTDRHIASTKQGQGLEVQHACRIAPPTTRSRSFRRKTWVGHRRGRWRSLQAACKAWGGMSQCNHLATSRDAVTCMQARLVTEFYWRGLPSDT